MLDAFSITVLHILFARNGKQLLKCKCFCYLFRPVENTFFSCWFNWVIFIGYSLSMIIFFRQWIRTRLRRRTGMEWTFAKNEGNRTPVSTKRNFNKFVCQPDKDLNSSNWIRTWMQHFFSTTTFIYRYPSRYGLYLKDKPNTVVVPLEYEPEDKPIRSGKA